MMTFESIRPGSSPASGTDALVIGRYRGPRPCMSAKTKDLRLFRLFAIYLDIIFNSISLTRERTGTYLLSKEDVFLLQYFREHKRLLIMHVVIQSTVNQVIHLILDVFDLIEQLAMFVALQIIGNGWQTHEPFGINRICN